MDRAAAAGNCQLGPMDIYAMPAQGSKKEFFPSRRLKRVARLWRNDNANSADEPQIKVGAAQLVVQPS